MSSTADGAPLYWVITANEEAFGPYDDEALAIAFALSNFGMEGWVITET